MKADNLVREHVLVNACPFISPMLQMDRDVVTGTWSLDDDEFFKLVEYRDYESAVREWIEDDDNVNEAYEDDDEKDVEEKREIILKEIGEDWESFTLKYCIEPYVRTHEEAGMDWLEDDSNVEESYADWGKQASNVNAKREAIIEEIDGDWRDFAEEWGIDPYMCEVYEHWLVSDWLAYKLQCQGKNIVDFGCGCLVWCRCATGQAISMDYVIKKIAQEAT